MADVNLQLVREFFELHGFRVLTNWGQEVWAEPASEHAPQLFVENVNPRAGEAPFDLRTEDLAAVERAVVHVRAWHADRFYPSVIEGSPALSRFASEEMTAGARQAFSDRTFSTILIISELPVSAEQRTRSVGLLREAGADYVIEFPVLLKGLLDRVSMHANYAASTTLQTIRLLKRYKLVRNQQLEFAFATEPPPREIPTVATVEMSPEPDSEAFENGVP